MLVQTLTHATGRGPALRLRARESVVGLGDRAAFVEIGAPVLSGPPALAWPYQSENRELMTRECIKHRLRWLGLGLKHEVFAIGHHCDASRVRGAKSLGRTHSRPLQPAPLHSPGSERWVTFASAPSAAVSRWFFNGLARTVEIAARTLRSASFATVRGDASEKPLEELTFNGNADDGGGADGVRPACSRPGSAWVVVMWIVRMRARPSRPKPISMPILRRKVAARRNRPARARGLSGQVLDLVTRSSATSARTPRRSEAVPVHTVLVASTARTAAATGSASITSSTASSRLPQ